MHICNCKEVLKTNETFDHDCKAANSDEEATRDESKSMKVKVQMLNGLMRAMHLRYPNQVRKVSKKIQPSNTVLQISK